jgi:uncharacterized coiled-coil DUF342 family protein
MKSLNKNREEQNYNLNSYCGRTRGFHLTEQEKNQIATYHQQIAKLKEQLNNIEIASKKNIELRDQLNEQVKKSWLEIQAMKTERDSINEKVKLLKEQRDATRVKTGELVEKIKEVDTKIEGLRTKAPHANPKALKEELEALEWKIQTSTLDMQEEKRLVENVKKLEIKLSGFKKIDTQYKKIAELQNVRKPLQNQADALHDELTDLAKKSQDIHVNMMSKIEQTKINQADADKNHQAFIASKDQINQLLVEIAVLTGQMKGLQYNMRETSKAMYEKSKAERSRGRSRVNENRQQKSAVNKQVKEKLGSEAKEKLARGEKLSWGEFQLMDDDEAESES